MGVFFRNFSKNHNPTSEIAYNIFGIRLLTPCIFYKFYKNVSKIVSLAQNHSRFLRAFRVAFFVCVKVKCRGKFLKFAWELLPEMKLKGKEKGGGIQQRERREGLKAAGCKASISRNETTDAVRDNGICRGGKEQR